MVTKPTLPPISGYVEVQLQGTAYYKDVETGLLYAHGQLPYGSEQPTTDQGPSGEEYPSYSDLAEQIRSGINEV